MEQNTTAVFGLVERFVRQKPNGLDVQAVDPRNGAKYSQNLHCWLTMPIKKHRAWTSRVYRDDAGTLWIGMLENDYMIGARLIDVLFYGAETGSCWLNLSGSVEVAEFWPRYVADGMCTIDTGHCAGFVVDNTR